MLFYKNRYLIAVYDLDGEILEDVMASKSEREIFLNKMGTPVDDSDFFNKLIKRHKKDFPLIKARNIGKVFYFIDVFEPHNDAFKDCDKEFLQECFVEDICGKLKKYRIHKQMLRKIVKNYKIENTPLNGVNLNEIESVDKILDTISKSR